MRHTFLNHTIAASSLIAFCLIPSAAHAQSFNLDGHTFNFHGFASQGYALSNQNNFLTMDTSNGSFAFTDGGLNLSTSITDKFRVGAQGYSRNIGQLGGGRITLDWAFGDYKFKDWFGIRAGKVKTVLGLFNDTQDAESLHNWAILPQSLYPLDLRTSMISHVGGDVYGEIPLHKAGSLSYTAYAGKRSDDKRSGYYFNTQDQGIPIQTIEGIMAGGDLRWNTPVSGLMVGVSFVDQLNDFTGKYSPAGNAPYLISSNPQHIGDAYVDYTRGKFRLSGEARRNLIRYDFQVLGQTSHPDLSDKGWFVSASYRVMSKLELGAYHSRYYIDHPQAATDPNANHIFDQVVTARVDLRKWSDLKIEGHFMDGYGDLYSAHGFYLRSNTGGTKPTTDMLVVRLGFYF